MKRVAVTGSSGFVGRNLIQILRQRDNVEIIYLDIVDGVNVCDWNQVKDVTADVFIHLANKSFVPDSYKEPYSFYDINLHSTLNMLELSRLNGAKFIYLSSYVYGAPEYMPIDENHPIKAFNPYATTKVMCEQMCQGYARDFNVPMVVFRPFNIYGVGQSPQFLIPLMIKQLTSGKIIVHDDRPKRDYIHVRDVANAINCAIDYAVEGCEIMNLGTGRSYSVREVADLIIKIYGKPVSFTSTNEFRPSEVLDTIADITKIKSIGWRQTVPFEDGLKEMILV